MNHLHCIFQDACCLHITGDHTLTIPHQKMCQSIKPSYTMTTFLDSAIFTMQRKHIGGNIFSSVDKKGNAAMRKIQMLYISITNKQQQKSKMLSITFGYLQWCLEMSEHECEMWTTLHNKIDCIRRHFYSSIHRSQWTKMLAQRWHANPCDGFTLCVRMCDTN